jgi:hypothetical protein
MKSRKRCSRRFARHTIPLAAAQAAIAKNWAVTPVGLPAIREHHYPEDDR